MKVLAAFTVSVQNDSECHVALVAELRTIHLAFENLSASLASLSLNSWSYTLGAAVFSPCKLPSRGACQEWVFSQEIWQKASKLRWSLQLKRRVAWHHSHLRYHDLQIKHSLDFGPTGLEATSSDDSVLATCDLVTSALLCLGKATVDLEGGLAFASWGFAKSYQIRVRPASVPAKTRSKRDGGTLKTR